MIPVTRREKILNELKNEEIVYIEQLSKKVGVSEQTIRRDLMYLEENGLVERYHGGAAKLIDTSKELSTNQRMQRFGDNKEKIGSIAASLINNGDVIFLDAGTSTAAIIKYLENKDITVFTNAIMHVNLLEKLNVKVYVVGGELKATTGALVGPIAIDTIKNCKFDKVFIGANGISEKMGCTNADLNETALKSLLIKQSTIAYIVCDSTKFGIESSFKFANLEDVTIISDNNTQKFEIKNIVLVNPL